MAKGKIALGAILGAFVGVVAGVLSAPRSGKETRTELKSKVDRIKRTASEKVEEGKEKATAVAERLKEKE